MTSNICEIYKTNKQTNKQKPQIHRYKKQSGGSQRGKGLRAG